MDLFGLYDAFANTVHPNDKEMVKRAYRDSLETKQPNDIIYRLLMQDGRIKYIRELCRSEFDERGNALYSIGSVQDITSLKEAEEQMRQLKEEAESINEKLLELDQLKSMFIASMSHELRTPLNSIIGFTGVILQGMTGEINEQQKEYLGRVHKAGQHLLRLNRGGLKQWWRDFRYMNCFMRPKTR